MDKVNSPSKTIPMKTDYFGDFPIPRDLLPEKLVRLLEPVSLSPNERVEVAARYENDFNGPEYEYFHMLMAVVPDGEEDKVGVMDETGHGVVSFSVPRDDKKGCCAEYQESISGYDYIVASRGDGSFYSYVLAEKIWMMLGLTPRCFGGDSQRIVFDDLSIPEFAVAEGEVSNEFSFEPSRNISWKMSNRYLRKYLWMRNAHAVRVFFYEASVNENPKIREIMNGEKEVVLEPDGGWYQFKLLESRDSLFLHCLATVVAVAPERCDEPTIEGIKWPGVDGLVTEDRIDKDFETTIILDDKFLERYEQNGFYLVAPSLDHNGDWCYIPAYKAQWAFVCHRVGRNLVKMRLKNLYKGGIPKAIPAGEVLHVRQFALSPDEVAHLDMDEEHIVAKTQRLLDQMLALGDNLSSLGVVVGIQKRAEDIAGFSEAVLRGNGWNPYPELVRLAQVAPLDMSQQVFLSRCKSLHEIWQRIPDGFLRELLIKAGCPGETVKSLGSLKLLQGLLNVLQLLNANQEAPDSFPNEEEPETWEERNDTMAPLFLNNDLRIADAHDKPGEIVRILEKLGVETASLNDGYGRALDAVYDGVINVFLALNKELVKLLDREDHYMTIVLTGWKGGTFGFRVSKQDRKFFRQLSKVRLELPNPRGEPCQIEIRLSQSFWRECPELRSKEIGGWMFRRGNWPWPEGKPPKYKAKMKGNHLRVVGLLD